MHAVDTNVLVRLIARDDVRQVAAAEVFVSKGAWIGHVVLVEAMWVLSVVYDRSPPDIATAIEMLLNHQKLTVQDPHIVEAALAQFCKRPALGFSDCLVLEVARGAGHLPLGTFDRSLAKLSDTQNLGRRRSS